MRVLVISQYWSPENGVPQRRWRWLSQLLIEAGHEVTVIAPPPHYQRRTSFQTWLRNRRLRKVRCHQGAVGEKIVRSWYVPAGNSLTMKVINQAAVALGALSVVLKKDGYLKNYDPDLIIGTVPALPTAAVTALVAKILRRPYVIDLRDAWPDLLHEARKWNESTGRKSLRERVFSNGPLQILTIATDRMLITVLHSAKAVIVTSENLKRDLGTRDYIDDARQQVAVIRNVFPSESDFIKKPVSNKPSNELNVLYAGTLGRAQNLRNAVQAANLATSAGTKINLKLVGAGAARTELVKMASRAQASVEVISRRAANDLDEFYEWADTALVHLTDWPALENAVPSKTYELMHARLHISGVVQGEAARLIEQFGAGHVVSPENPEALANLWLKLAENRDSLMVSDKARQWVNQEAKVSSPLRLRTIIDGTAP